LPIEWVPALLKIIETSIIRDGTLRFIAGVEGWDPEEMEVLRPENEIELDLEAIPGPNIPVEEGIFGSLTPHSWVLRIHGLVKGSALMLGLAHHHEGDDLVITEGWQAMLDGLGFSSNGKAPLRVEDAAAVFKGRIQGLREAEIILADERKRKNELEGERSSVRIAAETAARQRGLGIAETDMIGKEAADKLPDPGPDNPEKYLQSQILEDDHAVDGIMTQIRQISRIRLEHSAPVRIGCRMGRPEKSAPREKPTVHSLFPLALSGGNQRLMANAAEQQELRVQMGVRFCTVCDKKTPMITCNHRKLNDLGESSPGETCGGRTELRVSGEKEKSRRRGELQTVRLDHLLEDARISLGLDRVPKRIKGVKKLMSKNQTPEPIEKGILRAKHGLPVFRDGTIRFDMSDVPVTHFTPEEIEVEWSRLKHLGYTHDCFGEELSRSDQLLELFPQDFILAKNGAEYFIRAAKYIDDLLVRFYGMEPFYHVETPSDLVGQLICALAPHTSGGVLSRIIGFSNSSGGYAHPLFHASKRRNCDGDEDAIMLLMDGLLNFSREILPSNRGGQMDAPLVLTTRLNPTEVDKEALNVDSGWHYERWFYEATIEQPHPKTLAKRMDFVERRLGTVAAVRGLGFTHSTKDMSEGPPLSAYKTLETMIDKMNGQLSLGHRLRGVDVRTVASSVVRSHFLPDLRGNLVAFTRQKVRCLKCGHSYRRMPLAAKCIQPPKQSGRGMSAFGVRKAEGEMCNGNLALTVTEGAVRKYIKVTKHVMETYGVDHYTKQNVEWLADSADSLFKNDRAKQMSLSDFL
jgi:DNA polymerase II large subunit